MLFVRASGLVYRNPRPELRARHAWHPSLVSLGGPHWLCTFDIGEGPESLDYATYVSRSDDDAVTWSSPVPLFQDFSGRRSTHTVRVSRLADGSLIAWGARLFREDPDKGLINTATLGYTEMELIGLRSGDQGMTWSRPEVLSPPLVGPAFETCHPIVELADGRLLAPTSTWPGWDGAGPTGRQAVAFESTDGGKTWTRFLETFNRWSDGVLHWEQSVVQLPDGRLLAVAWALDVKTSRSLPTPYAISGDGNNFDFHGLTGLEAQTAKLVVLKDGRVLCIYRRHDRPGLWTSLVEISGTSWVPQDELMLWDGAPSGMDGLTSLGTELSALAFGYPSPQRAEDGDVLLAFWCREDCIFNIRWIRIGLQTATGPA